MAGLDVSHLSPDDAVVALRSFPRRYRAALEVDPDDDVDELACRMGPAGTSALDAIVDATSSLVLLTEALRQVLRTDDPVLHPAAFDVDARQWSPPPGIDVATSIEMLEDELHDLVSLVERAGTFEWSRPATLVGGGSASAIDVVREAVRTAADDLRRVEGAMAAARG